MAHYLTSLQAMTEIGARLKAYRIDYPMTQQVLAEKAGVSRRSITSLEKGEEVQVGTLIKVLMALELDANLDMLVPDPTQRPSYYLKEKRVPYQGKRASKSSKSSFKWGDETP